MTSCLFGGVFACRVSPACLSLPVVVKNFTVKSAEHLLLCHVLLRARGNASTAKDISPAASSEFVGHVFAHVDPRAQVSTRSAGSYSGITEKSELIALYQRTATMKPPAAAAAGKTAAKAEEQKPTDPLVEKILALKPRQYYALLNVPHDCDADALKKAYRTLALKLHPDKCQARGADEAFKRVSAAFAVLNDARQRMAHDYSGGDRSAAAANSTASTAAGPFRGSGFGARGGYAGSAFGDKDAEDLFRAFFGSDEGNFGSGRATSSNSSHRGVGAFDGSALAQRASRTLALGQRLMRTFRDNPWALVTLLSGLAGGLHLREPS